MNNLPDIQKIDFFTISDGCIETNPPMHECLFILNNGKSFAVDITHSEIQRYLDELPSDKVKHNLRSTHLGRYANNHANYSDNNRDYENNKDSYDINFNAHAGVQKNYTRILGIEFNFDEIEHFDISHLCQETNPCLHNCTITLNDRTVNKRTLDRIQIAKYIEQLPLSYINSNFRLNHFVRDLA